MKYLLSAYETSFPKIWYQVTCRWIFHRNFHYLWKNVQRLLDILQNGLMLESIDLHIVVSNFQVISRKMNQVDLNCAWLISGLCLPRRPNLCEGSRKLLRKLCLHLLTKSSTRLDISLFQEHIIDSLKPPV